MTKNNYQSFKILVFDNWRCALAEVLDKLPIYNEKEGAITYRGVRASYQPPRDSFQPWLAYLFI